MERKSYTTKIAVMELIYSDYRKMWDSVIADDRAVFCRSYDRIMEALEVMKNIDNNLIWVAFNEQYLKERKLLDKIINEFEALQTA